LTNQLKKFLARNPMMLSGIYALTAAELKRRAKILLGKMDAVQVRQGRIIIGSAAMQEIII
jgi:hypothetical protein